MFTTVSALLTRLPALQDGQAWEIFNSRYSPMLKRYFSSFGITGEPARDLTQDTIQKAIDGLRSGSYRRDKGRLRDWMGGIARNVLREQWRKARRGGGAVQAQTAFWEGCADPAGEEAVQKADRRFDEIWVRARLCALLRYALQSFRPCELRCYFLVHVHKRPIAQVAERLGMSVSAVYQHRRAVAEWLRSVGPRFISSWER
ncbi:MAG: sigma-70 family RNA polymerase sigma factor [Planctomycetota bacterium]